MSPGWWSEFGDRGGVGPPEAFGGGGHTDRLVGPVGVVVVDPRIELGLGVLETRKHPVSAELGAQGAMEPFDLAGRGW